MTTEGSAMSLAHAHADTLTTTGYALLGRVLPESLVAALNAELTVRYGHEFSDEVDRDGTVTVGDRRHLITVALSGVFSDPAVYANPAVMDVMAIVLGADFVLDSLGIVLSLPGSEVQHLHRDGLYLFDEGIAALLPAHAVTVGVPLVDMNTIQGTTEIFPGSHRISSWNEDSPSVIPDVPAGSCVMWDFRAFHRGTANHSTRCRPLLYMTYCRPWWRDCKNFKQFWTVSGPVRPHERICYGPDFFKTVPEHVRFLFSSVGA